MPNSLWADDPIFAVSGECAALMRNFDWTKTPLGSPFTWPSELRTLVSIILPALQPKFICWGRELTMLYNDAYAVLCADRHPNAMGQSYDVVWQDIWHNVRHMSDAAFRGEGSKLDEVRYSFMRNGKMEDLYFTFAMTPVRNSKHTVMGYYCNLIETTHAVRARNRQKSEIDRLQAMFRQAPGGIALLDGPDHVFSLTNDAFDNIIGHKPVRGKPLAQALPDAISQGFGETIATAYQSGEPYVGHGVPYVSDGGTRQRYFDFVFQPIRNDLGEVGSIFILAQDVTERVSAEQQQHTRNRELVHRLKNQLAMVQAIVTQTMRNAKDIRTAKQHIIDRIAALGRAHDLLLNGTSTATSLLQLAQSLRATHDDKAQARIFVSGDELMVGARPALSIALILHELSTNAVKYGSLSVPNGRVDVAWTAKPVAEGAELTLSWTESGGPPVTPPETMGTGSRLIGAGLNGVSWSEVKTTYEPQGLVCTIQAKLHYEDEVLED